MVLFYIYPQNTTAYITNAHLRNSSVLFEPDIGTKEERVLKEEVNKTESLKHAAVSDLELNVLEDSRTEGSKVTKKQTTWAVNCFTGWLESQGLHLNLITVEKTELNELLRHFYGSVQNGEGGLYHTGPALRAGINCESCQLSSVYKGAEFTSATMVFLGVLKRSPAETYTIRHCPLWTSISSDRHVMEASTPRGLLNKVWFEYMGTFWP